MSYAEIHEVTNLTQGNIGFLIHSGLKRLREMMKSMEEGVTHEA